MTCDFDLEGVCSTGLLFYDRDYGGLKEGDPARLMSYERPMLS